MTASIKVRGPADMLAAIPALLGFTPEQSVVVVVLRGPRRHGALRFDLPRDSSPAVYKRVSTQVIGMLCKITDVQNVVIAVHTRESIASDLPHAEFTRILLRRFQHAGFQVHDALCRASNGWGSYLDPELPSGGYSLAEVEESASHMPHSDEPGSTDGVIPESSPAEKARLVDELAHCRALVAGLDDAVVVPPELEPLCDLPQFVEDALTWEPEEFESKAALLLFVLQGPPVRDATMTQWAFGFALGDVLYDEAERFAKHGLDLNNDRAKMLSNLMLGIGPPPDRDRITRGIALLLLLVSRAEPAERCAPLCMLAWLHWARGEGTRSGAFIDMARAINPEYGMAELLDTIVSNGLMPEWVFVDPDDTA